MLYTLCCISYLYFQTYPLIICLLPANAIYSVPFYSICICNILCTFPFFNEFSIWGVLKNRFAWSLIFDLKSVVYEEKEKDKSIFQLICPLWLLKQDLNLRPPD